MYVVYAGAVARSGWTLDTVECKGGRRLTDVGIAILYLSCGWGGALIDWPGNCICCENW